MGFRKGIFEWYGSKMLLPLQYPANGTIEIDVIFVKMGDWLSLDSYEYNFSG